MKFSTNNFSNKEHRLIYMASPEQNKRIEAAVEAIAKSPDTLAADAAKKMLATAKNDSAESKTFLSKIAPIVFTKDALAKLKKNLSTNHGIELTLDATGERVKGVDSKEATPAKPGDNKSNEPALRTDANGKVTGVSDATKKRIEAAGSKLGQTIKSFIEALMPLIKSIQKIVNDIKAMIQEIVDDFKFDSSKLATTDKFIDKQIDSSDTDPKFIQQHFANTQRAIGAIDTSLSSIAGGTAQEKEDYLKQSIEGKKTQIEELNTQITEAPDEEIKKDLIKQRNTLLKEQRSDQTKLNSIAAKIARRGELEARLERIKAVAAARNIALTGAVSTSASAASTTAASAEKKPAAAKAEKAKTEEEKEAEKLKQAQAAAWDAYNDLQVALSGTDSSQPEVFEQDKIEDPIKAFNTAIEGLEDDAVKVILDKIGIAPVEGITNTGVFESVELDSEGKERFKLVYKKPFLDIELNDTGDNE